MATAAAATREKIKEYHFSWEGKDKGGKLVKGDMRAGGEAVVNSVLRRQGITVLKIKRQRAGMGGRVSEKDITFFTRQLATMMKSGVPLLQAFDMSARGTPIPVVRLLMDTIRMRSGKRQQPERCFPKVSAAFRRSLQLGGRGRAGRYFLTACWTSGDLKERSSQSKPKIKAVAVLSGFDHRGRIHHHRDHHDFRDPGVQELFSNFGADLPAPTVS